jgi:hypothetical protein
MPEAYPGGGRVKQNRRVKMEKEIRSPGKAIRAKCLDCSGNSSDEVKCCPVIDCPLWAFRLGKNPYRTPRVLTEEQKAVAAERLKRARNKKGDSV